MQCRELLDSLNDYVDGDTQSVLCQMLQQHLAYCNPCRIVIDNIRHTITLYRAAEVVPFPADMQERLHRIMQQHWAAKTRSAAP